MGPVKPPDPNDANLSDIPVQKAQVLWNEYKYRHDLVWRVLFQVTAAAVILSVAPYHSAAGGCLLPKAVASSRTSTSVCAGGFFYTSGEYRTEHTR